MVKKYRKFRNIKLNCVAYKWRAIGDDDFISIEIWPVNSAGRWGANFGPAISTGLPYNHVVIDNEDGSKSYTKQIVVTNRIIRRIIEYAIKERNYNPDKMGEECGISGLDKLIDISDAIRAK